MGTIAVSYLAQPASLYDLAELVSRTDPERFRLSDGIAFVCEHEVPYDVSAAETILAYSRKKPIYIVLFDADTTTYRIRILKADEFTLLQDEHLLSKIRDCNFEQLLTQSEGNCALESGEGFHFVTPSGIHATRFLRIADLISSKSKLLQVSFWLRVVINQSNAILIGNWSIAAPVIAACHLCKYEGEYDCLPEHPVTNEEACRKVILDLTERIPPNGTLQVLVSICGTGRLASFIERICREVSKARFKVKIISLYGFTSSPSTSLCWHRIEVKGESYENDHCELCKSGSKPINLDGSSYHLRASVEAPVLLRKRHFDRSRSFFERYRGVKGLFRLHRRDPRDGRHHAFDLDVNSLLVDAGFLARLRSRLGSFEGYLDLVVSPKHRAGAFLACYAAELLGVPMLLHDTLDSRELTTDELRTVKNARRILLLDDVLSTGSRLRRFVQSIREGNFDSFDKVHYLTCVARPVNQRELEGHSASFRSGHRWAGVFAYMEKVFLPRYVDGDCPWCREFDFLSKLAGQCDRVPDWLTSRLSRLRDRESGIVDEALLLLPGVNRRVVGADSPIFMQGADSVVTAF